MTARRRPGATEPGRARHIPVLLSEVVASLRPVDGGTYIDATFGAGGYTRAILEAAALQCAGARSRSERHPRRVSAARGVRRPAHASRIALLRTRSGGERAGCDTGRRHRARHRRLVDAARPARARLLVPGRRPARHAHVVVGAVRRRHRQRGRRGGSGAHPLHARRGAPLARHRAAHRQGARSKTVPSPPRGRWPSWSRAPSAAAAAIPSIRRRKPSRRCAST